MGFNLIGSKQPYRKRLEVLGNLTIFENMPSSIDKFISRVVGMVKWKHAGSSPARQIGVNIMAETVAIWEPTEYKSVCPHCSATNLSKIPALHYVCTACNKEYLAAVAHTEED